MPNPVIAIVLKFYAKDVMIGMTEFLGFSLLWLLTLKMLCKLLEFSKIV